MSEQAHTDDGDSAVPFEHPDTDVHEGIGRVVTIVDLSEYANEDRVGRDGRCGWCGYDRGKRFRHTEVRGETVDCNACGNRVFRRED